MFVVFLDRADWGIGRYRGGWETALTDDYTAA